MLSVHEAHLLALELINEVDCNSPAFEKFKVWVRFTREVNVMGTQRNEIGKGLDAEGNI